jgi:hypothetical protein
MAYLIALLGMTICVLLLIAFVRTYSRRLKNLRGPWILNEGRRND